tara:strand:+ start:397 stop:516 length:120 start_codon:yes stop_codon:yes gene_type:complete
MMWLGVDESKLRQPERGRGRTHHRVKAVPGLRKASTIEK